MTEAKPQSGISKIADRRRGPTRIDDRIPVGKNGGAGSHPVAAGAGCASPPVVLRVQRSGILADVNEQPFMVGIDSVIIDVVAGDGEAAVVGCNIFVVDANAGAGIGVDDVVLDGHIDVAAFESQRRWACRDCRWRRCR